jgi:hypothetical protein
VTAKNGDREPRGKLLEQVCARLSSDTVDELDRYVREREQEARVPLSRSLGVREVLEAWAEERRRARGEST